MLGKIAGTLGKKAETSAPHWMGAHAALGDRGEFLSLHWLGSRTPEIEAALLHVQLRLRGPNKVPVRISFELPEHSGNALGAGSSSRGLFFLFDVERAPQGVESAARAVEQLSQAVEQPGQAVEQPFHGVEQSLHPVEQPLQGVEQSFHGVEQTLHAVEQVSNAVEHLARLSAAGRRTLLIRGEAYKLLDTLRAAAELFHA